MLQFSSLIGRVMEAANHSKNSAMEAENHVKHGASSSLTSRGNFLRMTCFALLSAVFIFSGCDKDKDKDENDDNNGNGGGVETMQVSGTLGATYSSWSQVSVTFSPLWEVREYGDDSDVDWAVTAPISNGAFNLTLPAPAAKYLILSADVEFSGNGVTVSDKNAKFVEANFFAREDGSMSHLDLWGEPTKTTDFEVYYWYVDRNVNITGTEDNGDYIQQYDLNLKKGWNHIVDFGTEGNDGSWSYSMTANGTIPSGGRWD